MRYNKKQLYRKGLAILLTGMLLAGAGCGTMPSDSTENMGENGVQQEDGMESGKPVENAEGNTNTSGAEISAGQGTELSPEFAEITPMEELLAGVTTQVEFSGNGAAITGSGCFMTDGVLTITDAGTYILSGMLENGSVLVDAEKSSEVNLVLSGVTITNNDNAAVFIKKAEKANLYLAEGTTNTLTDGASYVYASEEEMEPNAALFSKTDMTISGEGILNVNANYNDGIVGKDSLALLGGIVKVTAAGDGIVGKDYLYVAGGSYELVTGGGAKNAEAHFSEMDRGFFGGFGGSTSTEEDSVSSKAVKTDGLLHVTGGSFVIDSCDDALHSNDAVVLDGGTYTVSTGDDGIHAETELFINGGVFNIENCYEGLEALDITINGGEISIMAQDDGVNAAGTATEDGADQDDSQQGFFDGGFGGGPGGPGGPGGGRGDMGGFGRMEDTSASFTVNDGVLRVNAAGDGLDANGGIVINGGEVYVDGPVNNGNGSMDYATNCTVNGGILVAAGSAGMAQASSSTSSQAAVSYTDGTQKAGTVVTVTDASGNVLVSYTAAKNFENIVISAPGMEKGSTCILSVGDKVTEVELTDVVTYLGTSGGMGGFGGFGGGDRFKY
ncbi:MAG: carbohydrate-binding domain-containing protein [Lachnospiraceae bacterium]|nr:carbohydrate-binding domain-containing protein [Lachnospiraceae bacterium]